MSLLLSPGQSFPHISYVSRNSVSRSCFVASSVYREGDVSRRNTRIQLNDGLNHQEAYSVCHSSRESDEKRALILFLFHIVRFLNHQIKNEYVITVI